MTHEFEYLIKWFDEDGSLYAHEIYVAEVEDDGTLGEYEAEERARDYAEDFASSEYDLDYEITLMDAR